MNSIYLGSSAASPRGYKLLPLFQVDPQRLETFLIGSAVHQEEFGLVSWLPRTEHPAQTFHLQHIRIC
jgi:hypothetical protein